MSSRIVKVIFFLWTVFDLTRNWMTLCPAKIWKFQRKRFTCECDAYALYLRTIYISFCNWVRPFRSVNSNASNASRCKWLLSLTWLSDGQSYQIRHTRNSRQPWKTLKSPQNKKIDYGYTLDYETNHRPSRRALFPNKTFPWLNVLKAQIRTFNYSGLVISKAIRINWERVL